ncbi:N-acetylmuramoyl-L-alanine amidase [Sinirhodobacter populi]|uniref:1,6-anhydro-N-acetylmuramyl-L-alanine amidase AmpD n=1 Tax=Paenirhodobacter populi TaxID=2306993 RepID=A0A443K215_9RHOB|nr:N-acetylmuramoyl-L-alanine amidase [Sinirhodobacter populi]RWR26809.1 N-acetylmuramoyl-L-alanine amidase [Sinirhodobacter populi]
MRVKSHKVEGLSYLAAAYVGAVITPTIVILHDTAGRLDKGNSATYLASKNSGQVSVHFVIERDGTITQLVPLNRRANHAGVSTFNGRSGCNDFAIGIEIVNPGKMSWSGARIAQAWWGQTFDAATFDVRDAETPQHGKGAWMAYTPEQIAAVTELLQCLFADVPTLKDITTHWYVSPGRKVDTNPLFPLDQVRAAVLGHDDPAELAAEAQSAPAPVQGLEVQIETNGDTLNLRRWPSFNPNVIAAIPDAAIVPVLRTGIFDGREWHQVLYGGQHGWIVASYAAPIVKS